MYGLTPSQTVGPFFSIGLEGFSCNDIVPLDCEAAPITITGQILDSDRQPVPDAVLEFWQADPFGRYVHPDNASGNEAAGTFRGWARVSTDTLGSFTLRTIKPGPVMGPGNRLQSPHINVTIFMRGLLRHLFTRMYFDEEPANRTDSILSMVPESRRDTLVSKRSDASGVHYLWNIVLQGKSETVFFDW